MMKYVLLFLLALPVYAGDREIVYLDNQGIQWKTPAEGRQAVLVDSLAPGKTPENVPSDKIPVSKPACPT